ncbi:MAG: hypothetical protein ACI9LU_001814 [Polaribacter sp.]|jgi:hypothetical protein
MPIKQVINTATKTLSIVFTALLFSFSSLSHPANPEVGKTYYTAHNLMFEKGRHSATNYWRGEMLAVNSEVKVEKIGKKKITVSWKGQEITFINVPKHTKISMQELADRMLSNSEVSLGSGFAKDIKFGEMRLGMTKDQVIKTRGYPPAHKTFSTEADRWTYWSSKFVQMSLIFENGKLVQGRGLR